VVLAVRNKGELRELQRSFEEKVTNSFNLTQKRAAGCRSMLYGERGK